MKYGTFSLTVTFLVGCIAAGSSFPVLSIQRSEHAAAIVPETPGKAVEKALSVRAESAKLDGGILTGAGDESTNLTQSRVEVTEARPEELASHQVEASASSCGYTELLRLGGCGCSFAEKMELMDESLRESCSNFFTQAEESFEKRCEFYTDEQGKFRLPLLILEFRATVKMCTSPVAIRSAAVASDGLKSTLATSERQLPPPTQIRNLLATLNTLNTLLGNLIPKDTPVTRRIVARIVNRGMDTKTARLIAYNNIVIGRSSTSP